MLGKIRNGEFTHLLVWKIDRISRNLIDFSKLYEDLSKHQVTFISQTEQFDTSSAMGLAMLRIILIFAQLESAMTAERIHAVLTTKASNGEWTGGHPPYGYRYDKETKEITVNEIEAQVVRYIFCCYEIMKSCRFVANQLNAQHLQTAVGNAWSAQAVEDILKNSFYIGRLTYNKRTKNRESVMGQSSFITLEEHHTPLIESKLFKICNYALSLQSQQSKTRTRKQKHCHVLSGLLFCAKCEQPLGAQFKCTPKSGWEYSIYACNGRKKRHCDNPYTSDLHLLPFVFFYLLRLLQVQESFEKEWSLGALETQLLDHPVLQGRKLTDKSLEELYDCMQKGVFNNLDLLPFQSKVYRSILNVETEKRKIKSELSLMENAVVKLEKLYRHPESTITEVDYISEVEKIHKEQERLGQILNTLGPLSDIDTDMKKDVDVFQKCLSDFAALSPAEIFSKVNPLLLQEFMNRLLLQVGVCDNTVVSLFFKNDLVQEFENEIL